MSDATLDALRDAIAAHLTDERGEGRIAVEYALVVTHVGSDPDRVGYMTVHDGPPHSMEGLHRQGIREAIGAIE